MDPHYWPSLYPGIAIGLLVGFGTGGWLALLVGALGGLLGAVIGLEINQMLALGEGFVAFIIPIVLAAALAKLLIFIAEIIGVLLRGQKTS